MCIVGTEICEFRGCTMQAAPCAARPLPQGEVYGVPGQQCWHCQDSTSSQSGSEIVVIWAAGALGASWL